MKKIGIIGGAGPEAGSLLFMTIMHLCQKKGSWKDKDFPQAILLNYPFSEMIFSSNKNILIKELQDAVDQLEALNCEIIAIACNTLHVFVPFVKFKAKFISIIDSVLDKAEKDNIKSALFVGTLTSSFANVYNNSKIKIVDLGFPNINNLIELILKNQYDQSTCDLLSDLIDQKSKEVEAVILGCTEFSVLHNKYPVKTDKHILDSTTILAQAILDNI